TYGIIRDPKYPTAMFRAQFEAVSAVEVLGPKVLEITFSEALAANDGERPTRLTVFVPRLP
ncbi:MAG TPA: hypothetical protein PK954_26175, partial [Anaerolineales bacterium]|nr:hypothetical protein [Anaerolineales bacterium]